MADEETLEEITTEEEQEPQAVEEEQPEEQTEDEQPTSAPAPEEQAEAPAVVEEEEEPEAPTEEPVETPQQEPAQIQPKPKPAPVPVFEDEFGRSEAEVRMELEKKKRSEREADEWKEYEETRKAEREASEREIRELRERRERRRAERAEEEKRLADLRQAEEQKRRAEEEERQRRKREEMELKKEEREQKLKDAEEKMRNAGKRNFVINKATADDSRIEEKSEVALVKSKEQLESEKKAILAQRIQPLNIDGANSAQLKEKAQELFNLILKLSGDKYDLEEQYKAQQMDMMNLQEKARQMVKGGKGKEKTHVQSNENDPLTEKIAGLPPKVLMYSRYERLKDRRSFFDRRGLFTGPSYLDAYEQVMKAKQSVEAGSPQPPRKGERTSAPEPEEKASEREEVAEVAEEPEEDEPDATHEIEAPEETTNIEVGAEA